jgi:beta-aspartyl-peptidase (threonine type)
MERSPHVMLIGEGADSFAASVGLEQVDPSFFFTERRWQGLVRALEQQHQPIPDRPAGAPSPQAFNDLPAPPLNERKFGTVGAVALDSQGRLAAGTSTGGMTAKRWGRVGDVPVIGAGTYASNADGCAVSATGDGEYFIRASVARDICSGMAAEQAERDKVVEDACNEQDCMDIGWLPGTFGSPRREIEQVGALGGSGGVIVLDIGGDVQFAMNTSGRYRGAVSSDEPARVAIYGDEELRP